MRIYLIGGVVVLALAMTSNLVAAGLWLHGDGDRHGRDLGWHDRYEHRLDSRAEPRGERDRSRDRSHQANHDW